MDTTSWTGRNLETFLLFIEILCLFIGVEVSAIVVDWCAILLRNVRENKQVFQSISTMSSIKLHQLYQLRRPNLWANSERKRSWLKNYVLHHATARLSNAFLARPRCPHRATYWMKILTSHRNRRFPNKIWEGSYYTGDSPHVFILTSGLRLEMNTSSTSQRVNIRHGQVKVIDGAVVLCGPSVVDLQPSNPVLQYKY